MAPSSLHKGDDDDFVFTMSDDDKISPAFFEEAPRTSSPSKKRKRTDNPTPRKSAKKRQTRPVDNGDDEEAGIWGAKEEDDGAMDPEFEFALEPNGAGIEAEFAGWGFEGARKGIGSGNKKVADIDEIIARRKSKKVGEEDLDLADALEAEEVVNAVDEDAESDASSLDIESSGDEFLAEDGFGMGVESHQNGSDEEKNEVEIEEAGQQKLTHDSDNDSLASPVPHPDDMELEDSSGEEDQLENAEEAARQKAFFAPDEEPAKRAKVAVKSSFQNMSLSRPILRGVSAIGFTQPTPIQAKTIPVALLGKDVVGGAVTGSGKTAAFLIPILERLLYRPKKVPTSRVAILTPTRELAIQCHAVAMKLASHTDIKFCLAVGGLSLKVQEAELKLRPDVIIATPGRFIDHMRNSASFTIDTLEILVLDEADRMLEDGFADELNEIVTTIPKSRQTMLFSATMTSSVDNLIRVGLNRPVRLMVDSQKQTVGTLVQEFIRLRPGRESKRMGYLLHLCAHVYTDRVIIFFRQKKEAHRVRVVFGLSGLKATELHGNMSQEQRIVSVEAFRDGKASFLLATDLASRGLDIKGVDTVINYEAPQSHEIYLHRVGRTARAGRAGRACTLAAETDRKIVKAAVKSGKAQGAKIVSRIIEPSVADKWADKVAELGEEIEEVLKEEKEDKQFAQVDMQIKKGENLMQHEAEIKGRPKRTWFETEVQKKAAKKAGKEELNGVESVTKKKGGKLSNKDKKKLDDRDMRAEGKVWKKGKAERAGKGALSQQKGKKKGTVGKIASRKAPKIGGKKR